MTKRWDSYIVISVGVGMTAAFCFLFLGPQRRDLSTLLASARAMRSQLARGTGATAGLPRTAADVQRANDLLVDYRTRITPTADVGSFVEEVSAVAARFGLRDRRIVPLIPEMRGSIMVLPIRISFESGFAESFNFLRNVERLPRAVRVTEFIVERLLEPSEEPVDGEGGDLRTELTMRIFYEAT